MPNGEISQIQLPNGDVYDIRDGNVSDFKTNIDEETLSDGQILKYNEDTGEFVNSENDLELLNTESGSIATFSDGGNNIPVNSFECEIVAQQAEGTPTPDNPLPITGFSQADIPVMGKNLFNKDNANIVTGYIGNTQFNTNNNNAKSIYIPIKPNTQYTVSKNAGQRFAVATSPVIPSNNTRFTTSVMEYTASSLTITSGSNDKYLWAWIFLDGTDTGTIDDMVNSVQIEFGDQATTYEPYTGNLYTVEFGQTIYGGRLIYANGQWAIEATHEILTLNGTENINLVGTGTQRRFNCGPFTNYNSIVYSSHFIEANSNSNPWGYYRLSSSSILILMDNNTQMSDVTALQTWLTNQYSGGTPVQFLCGLATPVIIPLTSTVKVKTISGLNNIYSNTGDVSLEYFVNKADDIDKLINAEKSTESSDYHVYSTDEQVVGKWIDGNDIYEKVVDVGALPNNATKNIAHGISNLGKVIQAELSASNNSSLWLTIPYATTNTSDTKYQIGFWLTDTNIVIKSDWDRSALSGYAILRYTKTSSNTRSLNLSKGSSEEIPIEELEEVKEVQDE